jgi:hypothetical protein
MRGERDRTELPGIAEKIGLHDCDGLEHVDRHIALMRAVCVCSLPSYWTIRLYSSTAVEL